MLDKKTYEIMKNKYGMVSSWAIWKRADSTPKSNTDSMSWVQDPNLMQLINTGFVFVGLNASSTHGEQDGHFLQPWASFHSGYRYQNDYRLRYALQDTKYWGSYITDVIKNHPEVDSNKVKKFARENPDDIKTNIHNLEIELSFLGEKPVLVAMGGITYDILSEHLKEKYNIVKIKHYSYRMNIDTYREEVLNILDACS